MTTWLERDVECGAPGSASRGLESINLRVRLAEARMPSFADNLSVPHHHGADQRIRLNPSTPTLGKLQGAAHQGFFDGAHLCFVIFLLFNWPLIGMAQTIGERRCAKVSPLAARTDEPNG